MKGAIVNKTKSTFSSSPLTDDNMFVFDPEVGGVTSVFTRAENGLVPAPNGSGAIKYLREDGTWVTPPDTNTVYTHPTGDGSKHVTMNGTTNGGKVLTASAIAGVYSWEIPSLYTHPTNHPPSIITQNTTNRFVTDAEKTTWNGKADVRLANLAGDLSTAEQDVIKLKVDTANDKGFNYLNIDTNSEQKAVLHILNPIRASARLFYDNAIGAIKIAQPNYLSTLDYCFTVTLFGHTYIGQPTDMAVITITSQGYIAIKTTDPNSDYTVRFGNDGINDCIWIGELNSVWAYLTVAVSDLFVSGSSSQAEFDSWKEPWDIKRVSSFDTIIATIENNLAAGDYNKLKNKPTTGLDLRASNLAGDLNVEEQDGIRTKIGITEAFTTALKTAYDSAASWVSTNGANVLAHLGLTNNPHAVTKSQVGLGNVPNLSFSGTNTGDQDLSGKEDAFSKNTAFNKNFGTAAGTASQGNDIRILNGQTAFTWGNHAEEGYLKNQDKPFSFTGSTVGSLNVAFTEGNYYGWSQFTPISQTNFNIIGMQLGGYVRIRIKTSTEPTVTYIGSDPSSSIRKIKGAEFIDNTEMELIIECVSSSSGYNRINYFFLTI